MRVVLLGTGVPIPNPDRFGTSLAVCLERELLMIDCGFGATVQILRAGLDPRSVTHLFFTHHHYDHNADYAHFALASWRMGRPHPLRVFGPAGTARLSSLLLDEVYGEDRRWRQTIVKPDTLPDVSVEVHEVEAGVVAEGDGWRVEALKVPHPPVPRALAYRVESGGRRMVFSGDVIYFPPLADFARDADLLIHEAMTPKTYSTSHLGHTSPSDAGRIAALAGAKRLVLTHLTHDEDPAHLCAEAGARYGGSVEIARDLMTLEVA